MSVSLPERIPKSVDVAIVGSGPAGATYARIISELQPNAQVAVFELGPLLAEPAGVHVKNIVDVADRARAQRMSEGKHPMGSNASTNTMDDYASDAARLRRPGTFLLEAGYQVPGEDGLPAAAFSSNVGGMAAHWTGACPRPGGAERVTFVNNLDELLLEGERLLGVTSEALGEAPLADVVRSRLAAAFNLGRDLERQVQPMPLAVRQTETGDLIWSGSDVVFGEECRKNPNFALYPEAQVVAVSSQGGQVTGLTVRDLQSNIEVKVNARFVVVAADALRTPQLLFASNIRPPALGRYLNDQPQIVHAVRLRDVKADNVNALASDSVITAQSGVSWLPYTDDLPFHGQVMQLDASPVPLDGELIPGSIVGLGWFCAKDLQPEDRVEFSETVKDDYGMPRMTIRYNLTQKDRETIELAKKSILEAGDVLGEALGDAPLEFPAGASLHYQGSVRMGESNDGTSVCDRNSQVWGVQGLYVAGNGVIPTPIACNPTLTSVALAVGGARQIASILGEGR